MSGWWEAFRESAAYTERVRQFESTLDQDWYTIVDAARVMGVHRKTVEGLIHNGELDASRPSPRKTRILKGAIAAYMARRNP